MARGFVLAALLIVTVQRAAAQETAPQLSKAQRESLSKIVAAVDAASGEPETPDTNWQVHLLRASDGSHYVAFSVEPPAPMKPARVPLLLYVRLATASLTGRGVERSTIGDWLAGRRSNPLLLPRTGIAIGEMPNFGAAGLMDPNRPGRPSPIASGSNDLKLLQLERDRARQEKEDRERQRRAELEGAAQAKHESLPFEDFDLAAVAVEPSAALQRALTAGPGEYELYVAWSDGSAKPGSRITVLKRQLQLPPATATELSISSVIVADRVATRTAPYSAAQQAANPYTIGLTELTPARDTTFSRDDRLNIAFQVINPRASELGKPDIGVTFRIVRVTGDREQPVASLTPQQYTAETLPQDFDLRLGHPIFAAMSAPLSTLARGAYRLKIAVNDRISGRGTMSDADFTIAGTPESLLAEAPSVASPFRRDMALDPRVIEEVVARLRPASPSAALARALETLRQRRFAELMSEDPVAASEAAIRTALTAIAVFALGDGSSAVQFQRAIQLKAPPGPARFFLGAARALEGRDADAASAWEGALEAGMPAAIVTPLLVNARFRLGEFSSAESLLSAGPSSSLVREQAAYEIALGREAKAIPLLETRLAADPADQDAEWLLVHALFASVVHGEGGHPDAVSSERFARAARAYIAHQGPHAPLVQEWVKVVTP